MRERNSVWFWYDNRVGVGPPRFLFLRLFRVMSDKEASIKECLVWDENVLSWNISVRRPFVNQSWGLVSPCPLFILTFSDAGIQLTFAFGSLII